MITVLTLGTFDLVHPGHVALFRECRRIADDLGGRELVGSRVVVAVNADEFVRRFKYRAAALSDADRPVMTCTERMAVVAAMRDVDDVLANDGDDQPGLIELVGPAVIAVGKDWRDRDYHAQLGITPAWLADRGIGLAYVEHEYSMGVSSSTLRHRLGLW